MKYNVNNKPIVCMQTNSTCYKDTKPMTIKGVLWHSTGANNPSLKRYVQPSDDAPDREEMLALLGTNANKNDWNHINRKAGLNAWIGKLASGTVAAVQTMPWNYRPWGCGSGAKGTCNDGWIQFEIAEDSLTNASYFNSIYKEACELTAYLCKMYNLDPNGYTTLNGIQVPVILCHQDSYKLGLGSNHADIYHWFKKYGKDMDDVRNDVLSLMNGDSIKTPTSSTKTKITVDGIWGKATTKACQKFVNTTQDGIVSGQLNSCKKYLLSVSESSWEFVDKKGSGSAMVKALQKVIGVKEDGLFGKGSVTALQKYLKNKGYYKGKIDGYCGNQTVKAFQNFLNAN